MEIPSTIIKTLIEWNSDDKLRKNIEFDKRFVTILLMTLIDIEKLQNDDIPEGIMDFVVGM